MDMFTARDTWGLDVGSLCGEITRRQDLNRTKWPT